VTAPRAAAGLADGQAGARMTAAGVLVLRAEGRRSQLTRLRRSASGRLMP